MRPLPILSALGVLASSATAQVVSLGPPSAVLSEDFSFIRGVRELSSGKLLIADWVENRVVLADFTANTVTQVMREGPGPNELRLPMGLVRYRGDSTLLLDFGNSRISVLTPAGRAAYTILAEAPGASGVRGASPSGEFFFAFPSWAERENALPDDSVRLIRWRPGIDARTNVAVVQGTRWRKDRSPAMEPRLPMVGYAAQDGWTLTPAGALVIVRSAPYRVEVLTADGAKQVGPALETTRRPVTLDDKRRFVREFAVGGAQSGRGENGGMGRAPEATARQLARDVELTEWATEHPPFDAGAVLADLRERVWVGAEAEPGKPRRYDVFDLTGRRVMQVEIGAGRRIAHVGAQGVYVIAEDADGIQRLERYKVP